MNVFHSVVASKKEELRGHLRTPVGFVKLSEAVHSTGGGLIDL
jgi:hypothetical protein